MTENQIDEIVREIAKALQSREYETFVSFFTDNAVFEIPFTVNGGTILKGLPKINEHFVSIGQNPLTKLIQIEVVTAKVYHSTSDKMVTVEYFTKGKSLSTGETFDIQSSIALIQFDEVGIVYYKDFPNTIGIAKKAGVLAQLAATWSK